MNFYWVNIVIKINLRFANEFMFGNGDYKSSTEAESETNLCLLDLKSNIIKASITTTFSIILINSSLKNVDYICYLILMIFRPRQNPSWVQRKEFAFFFCHFFINKNGHWGLLELLVIREHLRFRNQLS